jgi:hypothetical protein
LRRDDVDTQLNRVSLKGNLTEEPVVDMRVSKKWSAYGPRKGESPRIVAVCANLSDATPIAAELEKLNTGSLLTYNSQTELRLNPPAGEIDLFILIDRAFSEPITDTLCWLERYQPRAAKAVVGEFGAGRHELAARVGGAFYFVHQAYSGQCSDLVQIAVLRSDRTDSPAA